MNPKKKWPWQRLRPRQRAAALYLLCVLILLMLLGAMLVHREKVAEFGDKDQEFHLIDKQHQDLFAPFKTKGLVLDSLLLLQSDFGVSSISLDSKALPTAPYRIHIVLQRRMEDCFRVYFARSDRARYYLGYADNDPPQNGIFEETPQGVRRILEGWPRRAFAPERRRITISLRVDGDSVQILINGQKIAQKIKDPRLRMSLKIVPMHPFRALVDSVQVWRTQEDGTEIRFAGTDFHSFPFFYDLGLGLGTTPNSNLNALLSFFLLLIVALALEPTLLALRPLQRWLKLTSLDLLLLLFPLQITLLMCLRAVFGLPWGATLVCILMLCLWKLLLLPLGRFIGPAPTGDASMKEASQFILFLLGLLLLSLMVNTTRFGLRADPPHPEALFWVVSLAPIIALVGAALLSRRLPYGVALLCSAQLLLLHMLKLFYPAYAREPLRFFIVITIATCVVGALVHVGRAPRKIILAPAIYRLGMVILLVLGAEVLMRGSLPQYDFKTMLRQYEWNAELHTNLFGHHDQKEQFLLGRRTHKLAKPQGVVRVLCLGSSSTQGVLSSDTARFSYPAQLQRILEELAAQKVEVINGGVVGVPFHMLQVYLEDVLFQLSPDIIIVYFGLNGDNKASRAYYHRMKAEMATAPFIRSNEEMWAAMQLRWNPRWLIRAFLTLADMRLFVALTSWLHPLPEKDPESAFTTAFATETPEGIVKASIRRGAKVLLVPEVCIDDVRRLKTPAKEGRMHIYYEIFKRLARKYSGQGVAYKSVIEPFLEGAWSEHIQDKMHMDDEGYGHLARQMAKALLEKGFLRAQGSQQNPE